LDKRLTNCLYLGVTKTKKRLGRAFTSRSLQGAPTIVQSLTQIPTILKIQFNKKYFIASTLLFISEVLIAIYLKDGFIRHTFGDFLVVILIYTFVKSFFLIKSIHAAFGVLTFAFLIEFLQLYNLLEALNLQHSTMAKLILGSTFQVTDLMAYTLGVLAILIIEHKTTLA